MDNEQTAKLVNWAKGNTNKSELAANEHATPVHFLGLPREVRDKIYKLLLNRPLKPENQAEFDELNAADFPGPEHERQKVLDWYYQEQMINPDYKFTMSPLQGGRGLLRLNKQVHEEASNTLFTKNTFAIVIDGARGRRTFWAGHLVDILLKPDFPSTVSKKDFGRIEHLFIMITNDAPLDHPFLPAWSKTAELCLNSAVDSIIECGNKLKSLRLDYTSCFRGEVDYGREVFDFPSTGAPRAIKLQEQRSGTLWTFSSATGLDGLFVHTRILDSLKRLRGRVEDFEVRGDIRTNYIYELTEAVEGNSVTARKRRRQKQDAKVQPRGAKRELSASLKAMLARREDELHDSITQVNAAGPGLPPTSDVVDEMLQHMLRTQAEIIDM